MSTYLANAVVAFVLVSWSPMASALGSDWNELKPIIQDRDVPTGVRIQAMRRACDNPNPRISAELVSIARTWAAELDWNQLTLEQKTKDKTIAAKSHLLSNLIIYELPRLSPSITDHDALLALLNTVITRSYCSFEAKRWAHHAIVESPAPLAMRRATVLAIIADDQVGRMTTVHPALLKLLDASTLPALRQMVRQSNSPETLNYAAASALAHYGDQQIRPDLQALRPAFLAKHRNVEGTLIHYLWQIDTQHPPSGLLTYISSTEHLPGVQSRRWALRRAVELGLPNADIRQAILTHAGRNPPTGPYGFRPGLTSLKKLGLQLGVLQSGDLADVVIRPFPIGEPTSRPTRPPAGPLVLPPPQPWKPNEASYQPLIEWMGTINWDTIDPTEGGRLLKAKMCELDLLSPDECEGL